jgi:hypothetical protein
MSKKTYFDFFFLDGASSSASVFLFLEILLLFLVPSVLSLPFPFNVAAFLAAPPFAAVLRSLFFTSAALSCFLPVFAFGFCSLGGGAFSSSSSAGVGLSGSSICFFLFSVAFLLADLGCGGPFLGSFFDPDSFS